MYSWTLVIFFVAAANGGVAVTTVEGFTERGCEEAKQLFTKTWQIVMSDPSAGKFNRQSVAAECVQKK